jgi:hypothetical protein
VKAAPFRSRQLTRAMDRVRSYIYIYVLIESIYRWAIGWAGIKVVLLRFLEVVRAVAADGLKLKYTWHLAAA